MKSYALGIVSIKLVPSPYGRAAWLGNESALDQRKEALRNCLDKLSASNRRLLHQRYFENRSYQEISHLVAKKIGALYVLFSRLHQALLRCVERELKSV